MLDINVRGVLVATQAALKHMKSGTRIIMIGSSVGERVLVSGLVALLGHEGSRENIYSGVFQRTREPGHYGKQRAAGSNQHGIESRRQRLGGAAEGRHRTRPLRAR